jgi:hypothetical protein
MHHPVYGDIANLEILVLVEEIDESQVLQLFPYCVSEMETAADHFRNAVPQRLDHSGFKIDDRPLRLVSGTVHVQLLQNSIPHHLIGILALVWQETLHAGQALPTVKLGHDDINLK